MMSEETTLKMNMHGDHVASCLCCLHLYLDHEADWSDVTPGDNYQCYCLRGHFGTVQAYDMHMLMVKAPNCPDFEAKGS